MLHHEDDREMIGRHETIGYQEMIETTTVPGIKMVGAVVTSSMTGCTMTVPAQGINLAEEARETTMSLHYGMMTGHPHDASQETSISMIAIDRTVGIAEAAEEESLTQVQRYMIDGEAGVRESGAEIEAPREIAEATIGEMIGIGTTADRDQRVQKIHKARSIPWYQFRARRGDRQSHHHQKSVTLQAR